MGKDLIAFSKYLKSVQNSPFVWGEHDCVLHAVNGVRALTGFDIGAKWRGSYNSEETARQLELREFDGSMDNGFTMFFGEPHTNPLQARRGDVIKYSNMYGLVDDTGRFISLISSKGCLQKLPLKKADKIWRVECLN